MEKICKVFVGAGAVVLAYELGKYAGAAISMKQTLRKNPEMDKITCKFKRSELTIYQSKKNKAKVNN